MSDTYRISIERLENGFAVEVPDMAAIKKKKAESAKRDGGGPMSVYTGDCVKKFAAKTELDVIKIVRQALNGLGESEYDEAFEKADKK